MSVGNAARTGLAAITDGQGGFVLDRVTVRAPIGDEVRVAMGAAGVCHTDYASLSWDGPLVAGHEGAGWVEAVGPDVRDLTIGTPVLLNWAIPCGACKQCETGHANICDRSHGIDSVTLGSSRAGREHTVWQGQSIERAFNLGTFAEFTLVRRSAVTPLLPEIPVAQACILGCGVMTGVGSVLNIAQPQPDDSLAIVGCGGVGLSVIQGARLAGVNKIIAIDVRQDSLDRAKLMGATDLILTNPSDSNHDHLIAQIKALTAQRGVDFAFEATGVAALAFLPLRLVRNGGMAVQVSGAHGPVEVPMPWFWWDKRYVTPLYGGCDPDRDFPRLMRWAVEGTLDLPSMISKTYRLETLALAIDDMLAGRTAKGVVIFENGKSHV
ncbi:MAG: histidine kinase [Alphaproteobacteria bacterium PA3]|nr:MAG: histidine kinase [Alphaproteobacteria bacterium PA3]